MKRTREASKMEQPQIVTEIYEIGFDLGFVKKETDVRLAACKTAKEVAALRRAYQDSWMLKYCYTPESMTEEKFNEWVRSRPAPEEVAEEKEEQEWTESRRLAMQIGIDLERATPCITPISISEDELTPAELLEEVPDQPLDEIAQEITDSPEQEPVPLPYALKIETLIKHVDELGHQVVQLGHRLEHIEQQVTRTDNGKAAYEASLLADRNNLDADVADLLRRMKRMEGQHNLRGI